MIDSFLNRQNRIDAPYEDNLRIYRARIVSKNPPPGDDRLKVRIIPHMMDIGNPDVLPQYPPFFKGQVITGKSEDLDKKDADYVWVAALPDFTVGFVMGPANSYETTNSKFSHSYNFKDMLQGLIQRGVVEGDTDYKDLYVQYWNENYMEFVNFRTGEKFLISGNGTMIAMTRNQIYMRVGAENTTESKFSAIRMSRDEINFITSHFRVKAKNVSLGQKGMYVVATSGIIPFDSQGNPLNPQTHIKV